MKVLKAFSIPDLSFVADAGDEVKTSDLPKTVLARLQKNGFLSKTVKKAKKATKK